VVGELLGRWLRLARVHDPQVRKLTVETLGQFYAALGLAVITGARRGGVLTPLTHEYA